MKFDCWGSAEAPTEVKGRDERPGTWHPGYGRCRFCDKWFKLRWDGRMRVHRPPRRRPDSDSIWAGYSGQ